MASILYGFIFILFLIYSKLQRPAREGVLAERITKHWASYASYASYGAIIAI